MSRFTSQDDVKNILFSKKGFEIRENINVNGGLNMFYIDIDGFKTSLIEFTADDFNLNVLSYFDNDIPQTSDMSNGILGPDFNSCTEDNFSDDLRRINIARYGGEYKYKLLCYLKKCYVEAEDEINKRIDLNLDFTICNSDKYAYTKKISDMLLEEKKRLQTKLKKDYNYWLCYESENIQEI